MTDYASSSSKVNPAQVLPVEQKTDGKVSGATTGNSAAEATYVFSVTRRCEKKRSTTDETETITRPHGLRNIKCHF